MSRGKSWYRYRWSLQRERSLILRIVDWLGYDGQTRTDYGGERQMCYHIRWFRCNVTTSLLSAFYSCNARISCNCRQNMATCVTSFGAFDYSSEVFW